MIATRPGETRVTIQTSAPTLIGPSIPGLSPGQRHTVTLRQYDVFNLATDCEADSRGFCRAATDPTGSRVFADRLVAVFGASEGANVPNTNHCLEGACVNGQPCEDDSDCGSSITCCADHIEQQLFPVSAWGRRYVAAKAHPRGDPLGTGREPDVWRILAGSDGTEVQTVPRQVGIPTLARGEWVEFESLEDFEITASKAILVGQYLASEHAPGPGHPEPGDASTGDPAFILAVPVEQYRSDYVVLAPDKYEYDFLNVVAPTGALVEVDGVPIPPEDLRPIADGVYAAIRLPIADGVHRVRSQPDASGERPTFGVVVYGFDQYVSYGYPGGLDLARINLCTSDRDCGDGTRCCTDIGDPCADDSLGECVAE